MAFQDAVMRIVRKGVVVERDVNIYDLTDEEIAEGEFFCPNCRVRVYLTFPKDFEPYFAARGKVRHLLGCQHYHNELFKRVAHLDHTGKDVDLHDYMRLKASVRHRRGSPFETQDDEEGDTHDEIVCQEDHRDVRIRRVRTNPKNLLQLYGILKSPGVHEYAGHRVVDILVDGSTIHYHRCHTLSHMALVVCGRCYRPTEIIEKLQMDGLEDQTLCLRAPYRCLSGAKELYFILRFQTKSDREWAYGSICKWATKKYLAFSEWTPYLATDQFNAYIGGIFTKGTFRPLMPRYDCDAN